MKNVRALLLVVVGAMMISAYHRQPDANDPGTTSVVALLLVFCYGAMIWYGYRTLAVMLAILTTVLLYFKAELQTVSKQLTRRDITSVLQFCVLSLIILPILPDRNFGPYDTLNPYQVWWMVVLISGVSLAGYAALRFVGARYGAPLLGLLGGLVSSTATTMVFSRHARENPAMASTATLVILLANLIMVLRVLAIAWALSPQVVGLLVPGSLLAVLIGTVVIGLDWRQMASQGELPVPQTRNPTELRAALGFGLLYAAVLLCAAWLSDIAGRGGLYLLAFASGLTDVDAIALSSLRLYNLQKLEGLPTAVSILLAMLANLGFKTFLAFLLGGAALGRRVIVGMFAVGAGLAGGIVWLLNTSL